MNTRGAAHQFDGSACQSNDALIKEKLIMNPREKKGNKIMIQISPTVAADKSMLDFGSALPSFIVKSRE